MWRFFNLAKEVATRKRDTRAYLIGAVGIRCDGATVKACNGPVIMDTESRKSYPAAHAEARIVRKLDLGSIVFVCRVRQKDGSFGMARPCIDCQRVLAGKRVKRVYYTVSNTEYGVMYLG
jgi:tRNA(Arg) A34 adenosine deaminase TadA